jgi:hypothetical protein
MTVEVAEVHARVQRLGSVVKMAIVLEECTNNQQRPVLRFFVGRRTRCRGYS